MTTKPRKAAAGKAPAASLRKRAAAAEPVEEIEPDEDEESYSDRLIEEAAALLPTDAPRMLGIHQIKKNRRHRANLIASIHELSPLSDRLNAEIKDGMLNVSDPGVWEMLADVEDFMRQFAANEAEFDAWVTEPGEDGNPDDGKLLALFASFVKGLRLGEALSSSR